MDPSDMFARFVASLSRHLNDHAVPNSDLAAGLFVSRSHLDRIVGAVAGETPVRFRRRILLERAAYRLRTSDISVLDAAVEAGYGSSEAFTRAFQKAYACAPRAWRSSGAGLHIVAPNGVHFYPPGGLRLPARERVSKVTLVPAMVDHHVFVVGQMLDRASTLTNPQLDAPIELPVQGIDDSPTVRSLLSRLIGQMEMWNAAMANTPYDHGIEPDESLASMRERLDRAGLAFREYVREVSYRDRYDETYVDATGPKPYVFTAAGMIAHVLTYAAYRRTLVVGALASAGALDVDDDPLEWFAPGA